MRKIPVLISVLILPLFIFSQSHEIEALKKKIAEHKEQDKIRVDLINELNIAQPRIPLDEADELSDEAIALAHKLNYAEGEGYALLSKARVLYLTGDSVGSMPLIQRADSIAKKLSDTKLQSWVYFRIGSLYKNVNARLSLTWFQKAEQSALQSGDTPSIPLFQITISDVYIILGDYAHAMDYILKALKNSEDVSPAVRAFMIWENLAYIYSLIGEYDKANFYYIKQAEDFKRLGFDSVRVGNLYNNLGENFRREKKYKQALDYYQKAYLFLPESDDPSVNGDRSVITSNIADVYLSLDSLSLAFQNGFKALRNFQRFNRLEFESWGKSILARAYVKCNMPDSAIYYASSAYKYAVDKTGNMEDMYLTSHALADAYALKNDFRNAYNYYKLYIGYRDSIQSEEIRNKSAVQAHNFEMEKKEDQISSLNKQKTLQKNLLISILVVLALILISAFLLLRNNRQKQKANLLLQKQKEEIDEKAKELSVQKDNLQESYENVQRLGEIGRQITSSLSVNTIISTAYDNVNTMMDAAVFGIGIYHEDSKSIDFPATYENGHALPTYSNAIDDQNRLAALCFNSGKEIVINDLSMEHSKYLQDLHMPLAGDQAASLIYLPLLLNQKKLGVITVQSFKKNAFSDYQLYMLRNIAIYAAIAIENAESFTKINTMVETLQATQRQLIHAEKMASLGELTAGIAHEIQNPLNFVNNFSEVNKELADELKAELEGGNLQLANELADDIKDNSEKINHHGKRAEAIVKGMLQHSRSSSGQKEPTDINALCDEYLRLSYHGLRAKDKSFNATIKTDFDENIGKINIVQQDIGRVILNLLNNAFYATSQPSKGGISVSDVTKTPTVWVSTKKDADKILISVRDNGTGIPQNIIDKIFQPFFTTKPTGQGTGLGLSLSYDIVKAHNGELKVITQPGEGTEFTIELPC